MRLRRIIAPNMQAALEKVKSELGPDAVILSSRSVRAGGLFGFFGQSKVEVTAATDAEPLADVGQREQRVGTPDDRPTANEPEMQAIYRELREMRREVAALVDGTRVKSDQVVFTGALLSVFRRLVDNDIEEETARILVEEVAGDLRQKEHDDLPKVHQLLVDKVERLIPIAEEARFDSGTPKVIAMVGPTGVGKTTTIAKLAAIHALTHKKRVSLITADTYRIAAIEQLRTYSDIIGVPLVVVYSPKRSRRRFRTAGTTTSFLSILPDGTRETLLGCSSCAVSSEPLDPMKCIS